MANELSFPQKDINILNRENFFYAKAILLQDKS